MKVFMIHPHPLSNHATWRYSRNGIIVLSLPLRATDLIGTSLKFSESDIKFCSKPKGTNIGLNYVHFRGINQIYYGRTNQYFKVTNSVGIRWCLKLQWFGNIKKITKRRWNIILRWNYIAKPTQPKSTSNRWLTSKHSSHHIIDK